MKISGTLEIEIDDVDIEQAGIEHMQDQGFRAMKMAPSLCIRAAESKEAFKKIMRLCESINHSLSYKETFYKKGEKITCVFTIHEKIREEIES